MRTCIRISVLLAAAMSAEVLGIEADRIWLVRDGEPAADVYCSPEEWGTCEKLVARLQGWTGAKLMLFGEGPPPQNRQHLARLVIGTPEPGGELERLLGDHADYRRLNQEGYLIRASRDPDLILVAGRSPVASGYGVGELLNYRLEVEGGNAWCEPFEAAEQPALPHRWLWLSTSYAHWDARYGGPHITDETLRTFGPHPDGTDIAPAAYPGQMLGPDAYLHTYKAMVDWMSEHKLNGAMIFGYLNSGLDLGREVARYGQERGVDIIAGVGTMSYWGAYYGGINEYNIDTFMTLRPELTRTNERGTTTVCPSLPEMHAYWRRAGDWLARSMPELGGLYLENGDLLICPCGDCAANRQKEENDTGCYWDMMASSAPIIEGAAAHQPDWKYVYATYTGFAPEAMKTGTARVPPRFPKQFQPYAICQWTVTGMNESNWPEGLKAPTPHSVGLFHSPSVWGAPDGTDRWWAGPGSSHDDSSRMVRFYCNRMASSGFEGLVVKGMKNAHSPGPLLTYLALAEFSWYPERTLEEWEQQRLSRLFGGRDLAGRYLRLARDSSQDLDHRRRLIEEARSVAADQKLSPRARPYWQDLAEEMQYRLRLCELLLAKAGQQAGN